MLIFLATLILIAVVYCGIALRAINQKVDSCCTSNIQIMQTLELLELHLKVLQEYDGIHKRELETHALRLQTLTPALTLQMQINRERMQSYLGDVANVIFANLDLVKAHQSILSLNTKCISDQIIQLDCATEFVRQLGTSVNTIAMPTPLAPVQKSTAEGQESIHESD
jgi:hypothetical protein